MRSDMETAFGKRQENARTGSVFFTRWFVHFRRMGYEQKLRKLSFHSLERRRGTGYLIHALKIVKFLAKLWVHGGALFRIRGNNTLRSNGENIAREHLTTGLRSKSLAI